MATLYTSVDSRLLWKNQQIQKTLHVVSDQLKISRRIDGICTK